MSTPIDQLPGPQQMTQVPNQSIDEMPVQRPPQKVTFDETPVEITNVTMDIKKKDTTGEESFFNKKTVYESVVLLALYVLLGQPVVVYRIGNLLGNRFSNITMQLVIRGLLFVVVYYAISMFVLPKLN